MITNNSTQHYIYSAPIKGIAGMLHTYQLYNYDTHRYTYQGVVSMEVSPLVNGLRNSVSDF